jgi:hypothetical protein
MYWESLLLSILAGHNRYAHITSLMGDTVNSTLMGMTKVVSDDSARRALWKIDEEEWSRWLQELWRIVIVPCSVNRGYWMLIRLFGARLMGLTGSYPSRPLTRLYSGRL